MTYLERFRTDLLTLRDDFSDATGIAPTKIGSLIAGDSAFFYRLAQVDFKVGTYDKAAARFSALWPEDREWPAGIDRPQPEDIDEDLKTKVAELAKAASEKAVKRDATIPDEWPEDEEWPSDIPKPKPEESNG